MMTANTGKLTDKFRLPDYAQDMCYIVTESESAHTQGIHGDFVLEHEPEGAIRLTWGAADGPTLAYWGRGAPSLRLGWDGRIIAGGFIERLHARELGGLEFVIAEVVGGCFPMDYVGLPSLNDMRSGIFARPADAEPLTKDQTYPFVILADSNLAALAQDALVSGLGVDVYGSLASEAGHWHEIVGLPLLMESLTLLAP